MAFTTDSLKFIKSFSIHKTIYPSLVFEAFPAPVQAVRLRDHHRYVCQWLFALHFYVLTLLFFCPPFYAFFSSFLILLAHAKGSFSFLPKYSNTAPIGAKIAAKNPSLHHNPTNCRYNKHPPEKYQYKSCDLFHLVHSC